MSEINKLLAKGETIAEVIVPKSNDSAVDYTIHVLEREGLSTGDEVLLEIRRGAEPCVMIAGNRLELSVVSGFGRLAMVDLKDGSTRDIFLEDGTEATVPTDNILYWYESLSDDPLVVRDHCDSFDPTNERRLTAVVGAIAGSSE